MKTAMMLVSVLMAGSIAMAEGTAPAAAAAPAAAMTGSMTSKEAKTACKKEAKAAGKALKGKELMACVKEKTATK